MQSIPSIHYNEKLMAASEKDYQEHQKRKNLLLRAGFNQKGYCFLMEDTFLSIQDYLTFSDNLKLIEKNLMKANKNKLIQYHDCSYKTINKFKFRNTFDFYNVALQVHLVKITDMNDDVRKLVSEITNNKTNSKNKVILEKVKKTLEQF